MELNAQFALNNLSFGNCSYNILMELWKRNIQPCLFPIGNNIDISTFDKTPEDFKLYIQSCVGKAKKRYKKVNPNLRLWHITGSEMGFDKNFTLTMHELDSITETEANILNNQAHVYVCSEESKDVFETFGVTTPVSYVPLGFDSLHFRKLDKTYYNKDVIVMSVYGKAEKRKGHFESIKALVKKFGGNREIMIHLHITNPFFNPEQMNQTYNAIFEGKRPPFNFVILPFAENNSTLNDSFNATNIVIDASYGESWSLPSFQCVALGKHAVVHYCHGVKGWATKENSVLFFPRSKAPAVDGIFFHNSGEFNCGNWYQWQEDEFISACEQAIERYRKNPVNEEGLKLQQTHTWSKTVDKLLEPIQKV